MSMAARQHSTDDFGQAQREGHAARAKNRQFARATLCLARVLIPSIYDHVNVGGLQFGRRSTCIEIDASRQLVGEWYSAGFDAQLQCLRSPMAERQRIAAPRLSMVCIGNLLFKLGMVQPSCSQPPAEPSGSGSSAGGSLRPPTSSSMSTLCAIRASNARPRTSALHLLTIWA